MKENLNKETRTPEEKMKRMSIVVKLLSGWLSVFLGTGALFLGSFTSLGKDIFSIIIGLIIFSIGLILLSLNFIQSKPKGKKLFIKLISYFIGVNIIFSFWSYMIFREIF